MFNKPAMLAGALGGVAPTVVRLVVNYSSPTPDRLLNQPIPFFAAMVGFALLAALMVWVFQETNLKQALFLGIALPSLIQTGSLQKPSSSTPPTTAPPNAGSQTSISLISSAYAQETPPTSLHVIEGRKLELTIPEKISCTVAFYGANNALLHAVHVSSQIPIDVPSEAVKFAVQVGESTSLSYELPTASNVLKKGDVKIEEKAASGFLQGVGLARNPQYSVTVRFQ